MIRKNILHMIDLTNLLEKRILLVAVTFFVMLFGSFLVRQIFNTYYYSFFGDLQQNSNGLYMVASAILLYVSLVICFYIIRPIYNGVLFVLKELTIVDPLSLKRLGSFFITFLFVVIVFAAIYSLIYQFDGDTFSSSHSETIKCTDFLYFSIITITTLGYGDICPVGTIAKFLTSIEVFMGIIIVAGYLSLVISNYSYHCNDKKSLSPQFRGRRRRSHQ